MSVASGVSVAVGVAFLDLIDRSIPHIHFISGPEGPPSHLRRIWLLVLAITIHNIPEGLSVGVSFGTDDIAAGTVLAIAIGLQNMPEGLAVALPLIREGLRTGTGGMVRSSDRPCGARGGATGRLPSRHVRAAVAARPSLCGRRYALCRH